MRSNQRRCSGVMEHRILFIMVLTGLCTSGLRAIYQYHFIHQPKSFADAQLYCRTTYSDLATITSMVDMRDLLATVTDGYAGMAWIGLYKQNIPAWHWSLSTSGFYAKGEREYRNWGTKEPDPAVEVANCGVMDPNGQFFGSNCSYVKRFICYDAVTDQYILINPYKTWREAQSYCRLKYTDLASVRNLNERLKVQRMVAPGQLPYIGLFRDNFTWSDNRLSSFRNWASDQPIKDDMSDCCVGLNVSQNKWACGKCTMTMPFFCYSGFKRSIVRVKVQLDQTVRDPMVKRALLTKIQEKLKEHGTEDFTVRWRLQPDGNIFQKICSPPTNTNCD